MLRLAFVRCSYRWSLIAGQLLFCSQVLLVFPVELLDLSATKTTQMFHYQLYDALPEPCEIPFVHDVQAMFECEQAKPVSGDM